MLNKRWKRKVVKTEHVSERMATTTIKYQQRRIELASVYFLRTGTLTFTSRKCTNASRTTATKKQNTIIAGDSNAQLGPGDDSDRDYVGKHAMREPNKRGIWVKQWSMTQKYVALNTTFKKNPKSKLPSDLRVGKMNVLIDSRSRRYCTNAEANDMIHLGSDHRSVTAHFRHPCGEK